MSNSRHIVIVYIIDSLQNWNFEHQDIYSQEAPS